MKLKVQDWRQAWFESHISDRFFQEMSKVEKGAVQGLDMTAQWMEQIMIEVGLLAQAMIRLEHDGAPEPQIKLAYEKALRLAALSMHLITALDGADRAQLRSPSIVRNEPTDWAAPRSPLPPAAVPAVPALAAPAVATAPRAPASPAAAAAAPAQRALVQGPTAMRPPVPVQVRERKPAASRDAAPAAPPAAPAGESGPPDAPLFSSLLQVSGRNVARSESQVRQTIVSLWQQGLSRAEIEVVTGEPRHVVEAVLNHARSQAQAGAQTS
jgi:hypothetical protein